ncbi:ABC transporter substrate-binding protein [Geodermatophilus sp. DSM 44513]|uniref:ABC transporter substrate-binding protein n=1 Tax=Geodermatophilus sp. DSM 44513 TaxID=1528104 RepID=UPI00126E41D9|nr:ABC transporter substrate-binding protein [Geodermatophilus sp. DSM 44513]WNV77647.1 ABC transporter substrate-binding protein [Geodermatophilus sp. DSM 44513]
MPTLLAPPASTPPADDATRRDLLKGAGLLTVAGFLAACGGGDVGGPTGRRTRTVEHTAGTTEVPVDPQRVVALDGTLEFGLIALDLAPVAVDAKHDAWREGVADLLPADLDLTAVPRFGAGYEPDLEAVAGAAPEVVVGTDVNHTESYDRLSQIAPTELLHRGALTWTADDDDDKEPIPC